MSFLGRFSVWALGVVAAAFVLAYGYVTSFTHPNVASADTQCLPNDVRGEKTNPNQDLFISCGGFL